MEEVTDAEMEDQEKYGIFSHCEFLIELPLDSLRKEVEIEECEDGDDVANSSCEDNNTEHRKHEGSCVPHRSRLAAELGPVGSELCHGAVDVGDAGLRNKPFTFIWERRFKHFCLVVLFITTEICAQ